MAANDPGLGELGKVALEGRPSIDAARKSEEAPEDERPVAPDQFDERYETTRKEIWSYYA